MARRARSAEEIWYDLFTDWDVNHQAAALWVLAALHRQKKRERDLKAGQMAPESVAGGLNDLSEERR